MSTPACAYCGLEKPLEDYPVPPHSFFATPPRGTLPIVSACEDCMLGTSEDDEYFRDVLEKYFRTPAKPAVPAERRLADLERVRAFTLPGNALGNQLNNFLGTPAGTAVDSGRLMRTSVRYVRGLYAYELGAPITDATRVKVMAHPGALTAADEPLRKMFADGTTRVVDDKVFTYQFKRSDDDPDRSTWLLTFHDAFHVMGMIRRPLG